MLTGRIPKLLKEAGQVKEALEKIGQDFSKYEMLGGIRLSERKRSKLHKEEGGE